MRVNALDHVNIITDDMAGTTGFYADLLDLEVRDGPPPFKPEEVQWLFDSAGRAIIHVNRVGAFQVFPRESKPGPATGAVHHVAFDCSGHAEVCARLERRGLSYSLNDVDSIGLRQIFVIDPNGVLLELNFRETK